MTDEKEISPKLIIHQEARKVLEKLPSPEAIVVLEDWMDSLARDNNNNNNNLGAETFREYTAEEAGQKISDEVLKSLLRKRGII